MNELLQKLKKLGLIPVEESEVQYFTTGVKLLDIVLGKGYPLGRIIELFGSEGSGKSYLSLLAIAAFQKAGKKAVLFDVENSFDPVWASKVGVDVKNLLVLQADYGEQVFEGIRVLAEEKCDLVVIDSTAALAPKSEIEGDIEDQTIGLQARMISKSLRMINASVAKNNTLVIFINQLREKMNISSFFGDSSDSPGGRALKFYSSVRIRVEKGSLIKDDKNVVGHHMIVKVVKNKVGKPYGSVSFPFYYGRGIDEKEAVLEYLLEKGIITQSGRKYTLKDRSWSSFAEMYNSVSLEELLPYFYEN